MKILQIVCTLEGKETLKLMKLPDDITTEDLQWAFRQICVTIEREMFVPEFRSDTDVKTAMKHAEVAKFRKEWENNK